MAKDASTTEMELVKNLNILDHLQPPTLHKQQYTKEKFVIFSSMKKVLSVIHPATDWRHR